MQVNYFYNFQNSTRYKAKMNQNHTFCYLIVTKMQIYLRRLFTRFETLSGVQYSEITLAKDLQKHRIQILLGEPDIC